MDEVITRIWADMVARVEGPFAFRFVLQPVMAALFAIRDGAKDARQGRPPYLLAIFTRDRERSGLLREGAHAVGRVMLLGGVMDAAFQLIVFRHLYPFELIVIVLLLAFVPYILLRGPANRLASHFASRRVSG